MTDNFTSKEIEAFKLLHEMRKNAQVGEITITFFNFDYDKIKNIKNISYEMKLRGQETTASLEFLNRVMGLGLLMKEDEI